MLHSDPVKERMENSAKANKLVRPKYREHWGAPKDVYDLLLQFLNKNVGKLTTGPKDDRFRFKWPLFLDRLF